MSISFDQPLALALLPPSLALVYLLWRTSRVYLPPVRRHVALALRLLAVTLVGLVLSAPNVRLNANDLAVAVLLDRSDSVSPAQKTQEEAWVADALAHKSPSDQMAVVSFAGEASLDRPLSKEPTPPTLGSDTTLDGSRTDIAKAIQLGLAVLPPDAARRIVLISDGNQNSGDAEQAAALARSAGVQLETVPLTGDSGPQALVEALDAPARLHQGDSFTTTAQVRATQPMQGRLQLLADDRLVASQDVQLQAGSNRFLVPIDSLQTGTHVLKLILQADDDPRPQNKTGGAYVIVEGPPRVLIVEGAAGQGQYLAGALQAAGLQVDLTRPQDGPFQTDTLNNYASVILANVSANLMSPDGMTALNNYVQSHGGGLVVSGGDHAYGPGLYARTPLENMLPVQADLRGSSLQAGVGLVLAIDTSGSMGEDVGGATIMDMAKEAALAAAESLGPGDEIGLIAFESNSTWAIPPTPASQTDQISAAVNQMSPGGGDDTIEGALKLSSDGLNGVSARNKHVVIITDGETPGGNYDKVIQQLRASGVTVSTIGIGNQADTQLLQLVAQQGGGAYYDGSDPFNLPQLVLKETQELQRAAIVERQTQAIPVNWSPILQGIDPQQLPGLRGYVATTPKPQSTVILATPTADPLLVEWQFGLGRVIVWTSDATNRWASGWLDQGQSFEAFWAQLVKRTIRPPEDPNRQVSVNLKGNQAKITLDAASGAEGTASRQYVNFLPSTVSVVDPQGVAQRIDLPQVAPGEYQTTVAVPRDGVYTLQVTESEADGGQSTQSAGFVVPYSPEYRDLATNSTLLDALASGTGGHSIQVGDQAFTHDLPAVGAPRPTWPMLLMLLALVLVADVAVRRVRFSSFEVRSGYAAVRKRLGYVDEAPAWRGVRRNVPTVAAVPLVSAVVPAVRPSARPARATVNASVSHQLLAAKKRAAKR
jgi:Mg-chelatase subunit ChlD/uncharacterized membrane protein